MQMRKCQHDCESDDVVEAYVNDIQIKTWVIETKVNFDIHGSDNLAL